MEKTSMNDLITYLSAIGSFLWGIIKGIFNFILMIPTGILGKFPFKEYFLPEAAVMLKQGAGRLIRSETDTGILAVCDSRLTQMGYGARLLKALPPMRRLASEEEFARCLKDLAAQRTDPAVSGNT